MGRCRGRWGRDSASRLLASVSAAHFLGDTVDLSISADADADAGTLALSRGWAWPHGATRLAVRAAKGVASSFWFCHGRLFSFSRCARQRERRRISFCTCFVFLGARGKGGALTFLFLPVLFLFLGARGKGRSRRGRRRGVDAGRVPLARPAARGRHRGVATPGMD